MSKFPEINPRVVSRLQSGDWSFGCAGRHHWTGTPDCPVEFHHHHDEFCSPPNRLEVIKAGIDPEEFGITSRR